MKAIKWTLLALALLAMLLWGYALSGAYGVGADEPHWRMTERLLDAVRSRSVAARAASVAVPDLSGEANVTAGAGNYDAMCASCHLQPGVAETELSAGLYPAPPDLTARAADPAEAFWVIRHGLKMTGMPAWGGHMGDRHIWDIVAFLQRLPALTADEYRTLVEASGGHSHGPDDGEDAPKTHVHADGKAHQH